MAEFTDGSNERICNINTVEGALSIGDMNQLGLQEIPAPKHKSFIIVSF